MATLRSSWEFMARAGLTPSTAQPAPRLSVGDLLMSVLPIEQPTPEIVRVQSGDPPPDRVSIVPWPNTPEATND